MSSDSSQNNASNSSTTSLTSDNLTNINYATDTAEKSQPAGNTLQNNPYIHSLSIITFDLEIGQKIQQYYPEDIPLSAIPPDLPFMSFPDSNASLKQQELLYWFVVPKKWKERMRGLGSQTPVMSPVGVPVFSTPSTAENQNNETHDSADQDAVLYGHVYFKQQPSEHIPRGYIMKSLLLLTKLPFMSLYQNLIKSIGRGYWREMSEMAVIEEKPWDGLGRIWTESLSWRPLEEALLGKNESSTDASQVDDSPSTEATNQSTTPSQTLTLNLFDETFTYHLPQMTPQFLSKSYPGRHQLSQTIDLKYDEETGEVRSASSLTPLKEHLRGRCHVFQREVSIYKTFRNHLDHLIYLWELVIIGEPILVRSPTPTQCSEAVIGLLSLISPIFYGGDFRPYFTVHNVEYKRFSDMGNHQGFESIILGVTNPFFNKSFESWPHYITVGRQDEYMEDSSAHHQHSSKSELTSVSKSKEDINSSQEDTDQTTSGMITSPDSSSGATKSAVPSQKRPSSSSSSGMNHIKRFSTSAFSFVSGMVRKRNVGSVKTSAESRQKLMWEYEEQLWSCRKWVTKNDLSWQDKLVDLDSHSNLTREESLTSASNPSSPTDDMTTLRGNDTQILMFFENLTERFLFPLQQCFDSLRYKHSRKMLVRSEHKTIMKREVFYNYVQKHGYRPEIFAAPQDRVLEMYQKFIYSKNFESWLEDRMQEEYLNLVLYGSIDDLIGRFSEVGLVDLFGSLKDDLHNMRRSNFDSHIVHRLEQFMDKIISRMPDSLQDSLRRMRDGEEMENNTE